jgi:hypothetical protein
VALSPQANFTGRATANCRRNLVPTFVVRGVSAADPLRSLFSVFSVVLLESRMFLTLRKRPIAIAVARPVANVKTDRSLCWWHWSMWPTAATGGRTEEWFCVAHIGRSLTGRAEPRSCRLYRGLAQACHHPSTGFLFPNAPVVSWKCTFHFGTRKGRSLT